ncbi:MAG: class I SAM-dependent RNA methyltransferase [Desulfomonilia bacterium]
MDPDRCTITVESLSYGGRGVGRRQDGKVVFVPMVLPGERVRVRPIREHRSYVLAELEEVLEPSSVRIVPRCEHFAVCGGCDWQHIAYLQQMEYKQDILNSELSRTCCDTPFESLPGVASPQEYSYRCHATLQCDYTTEFISGFFKKASRDIVAFDTCPVLNDAIQAILTDLRGILSRHPIYGLSSIEIHAPQDEVLVLAHCRGPISRHDLQTMHRIYDELPIAGLSCVVHGARRRDHVLGQRFTTYDLRTGGKKMKISSGFGGFLQANMGINESLAQHVMDLSKSSEVILELFSGSGNFSIPLAHSAREVVSIEKNSRLTAQSKINAKKNHLDNVRFLSMDALKAVQSAANESLVFDTVVLDPPREGARQIMEILPETTASRIIYISCNPTTLSRDVSLLVQAGFSLQNIKFFDMFPQTYHIESVAYLQR